MEAQDLVTVYTTTDAGEADVLHAVLQEHGIRCEVDGAHQAGFTGTLKIGLLVRAIDADHARRVIESHGQKD
ncbi:MAG: DUF2007 domain-containing protein [Pirellulaceae bacterium]|nr:DUF2007 domain-containing protein [Planctomycetales bacterium]MCA9162643.1 DUF2007 domain-containing protein [Planctomycetales bacterium]